MENERIVAITSNRQVKWIWIQPVKCTSLCSIVYIVYCTFNVSNGLIIAFAWFNFHPLHRRHMDILPATKAFTDCAQIVLRFSTFSVCVFFLSSESFISALNIDISHKVHSYKYTQSLKHSKQTYAWLFWNKWNSSDNYYAQLKSADRLTRLFSSFISHFFSPSKEINFRITKKKIY